MKFATCYKCGQRKLASVNPTNNPEDRGLTVEDVEMLCMGYGKHRNQFRCKNCKDLPRMHEPNSMEHDENDLLK